MPDNKYGRIFTEKDLKTIVQACMEREIQGEDQLMEIINEFDAAELLRFPPDEPCFVLRGQDRYAEVAVIAYAEGCERGDASDEHIHGIERDINKFRQFCIHNPDRMKVPD